MLYQKIRALFFFFSSEIKLVIFLFSQANLSTTGDTTWKDREAAVLAHGAIAEGCINGLYPHLPEVNL